MSALKISKKTLLCAVLLSFLLGLMLRTLIINIGEPKILFYKTFQPTYAVENYFN